MNWKSDPSENKYTKREQSNVCFLRKEITPGIWNIWCTQYPRMRFGLLTIERERKTDK